MKLNKAVKPLSYVKAHASEIINSFSRDEDASPIIITQNGEAKAVLMSIQEYEAMQEGFAMLQLLEMSRKSMEAGEYELADKVLASLRKMLEESDA